MTELDNCVFEQEYTYVFFENKHLAIDRTSEVLTCKMKGRRVGSLTQDVYLVRSRSHVTRLVSLDTL